MHTTQSSQEEDEYATWDDVKVLLVQLKKMIDKEKQNPHQKVVRDEEKVEISAENASEALRDLVRECVEKQPNGKTPIEEDIDKTLSHYLGHKKEMKNHQRKLEKLLSAFGYPRSSNTNKTAKI